jgi:hypothetical protein
MSFLRNRLNRVAVLLLPIALGACDQHLAMNAPSSTGPRTFAWDGAGEDPNRPQPKRQRVATPRVAQGMSGEQEPTADEDSALARKLAICRGCLSPSETAERPDGSRVAAR